MNIQDNSLPDSKVLSRADVIERGKCILNSVWHNVCFRCAVIYDDPYRAFCTIVIHVTLPCSFPMAFPEMVGSAEDVIRVNDTLDRITYRKKEVDKANGTRTRYDVIGASAIYFFAFLNL